MKSLILFLSIFISLSALGFDHSHKEWAKTLSAYLTNNGLMKYQLLKTDIAKYESHQFINYIQSLQKVKLSEFEKWNQGEQTSFLINAYNAFTVQLIINHYPVKSIKKIGGFFGNPWKIKFFKLLDGKIESLDPIEHEWLRPKYKDYRIHAAVNCASISCPALRREPYIASKLDQQLNEQMTLWLKDSTRNDLSQSDTFSISKIFDWYKKDFEDWGGGILKVIAKFGSVAPKDNIKIKYLNYNWDLNESR